MILILCVQNLSLTKSKNSARNFQNFHRCLHENLSKQKIFLIGLVAVVVTNNGDFDVVNNRRMKENNAEII